MNPHTFSQFFPFLFLATAVVASAQPSQTDPSNNTAVSFRPSVAIVIAIFSIMFSLTFLLLMYAKFCHSATSEFFSRDPSGLRNGGLFPQPPQHRTFSGIDKTLIESLPFFRFSSLKGSRDGLECSVCLSKFGDTEILRLLPKCKHAFHIDCVDRWLESHSTCPLCRYRVDADDVALFKYSSSSRFLFRDPSTNRRDEERDLELFVEREPDGDNHRRGSGRSSRFGSSKKFFEEKKEESPIPSDNELLHKFKHTIIVSDVVFKSRWSDVNSSDLMSLNSEMLNLMSSKRFSAVDPNGGLTPKSTVAKIKEEIERKRLLESKASEINRSNLMEVPIFPSSLDSGEYPSTSALISPGNRCRSEITNVSRFRVVKDDQSDSGSGAADEKVRRLWLPIARRTVQWFAGRERGLESQEYTRDASKV